MRVVRLRVRGEQPGDAVDHDHQAGRSRGGSAAGRRASPRPAGIAAEIQLALDRRLLQRVPEHLRPVLKTPHQHIPSEQRQQIPPLPKPEIILEMTARVISTASVHLIVVKCV